jgi:predicted PurR-regulated permease PerM
VIALLGATLVVAVLHFGRPVLLPLVMTVLSTFLLRPAAVWMERHKIPRGAAVGVVAVGILVVIGGAGWIIAGQFRELALHLDEYRGHMRAKIEVLQHTRVKSFENLRAIVREVAEAVDPNDPSHRSASPHPDDLSVTDRTRDIGSDSETSPPDAKSGTPQARTPQTPTVKIVSEPRSPLAITKLLWDSLSTPLGTSILIFVLVLFALAEYEELRNRVYRLAGRNKLTVTTRALDEAGKRISRYLAAYAVVNCGFGILVFLGLSLLGVHYPVLWGFLAATMRFLPYVGVIAGAGLPICMAVIQFPDWTHPALVMGLFLVIEVLTNSFVEPVTYGKSAGVSPIALLVSALFWAWIWGPMGLMLSVPLTVVLAVLGKHVPQFEVLRIVLADEPALAPHVSFYQRLLAGDTEEAAVMLDEHLASIGKVATYDQLIIPALALAERDRRQGDLEQSDFEFVWKNAAELVEDHVPAELPPPRRSLSVFGCAAENPVDELALLMLQQIVVTECELAIIGAEVMASEKIAALARSGAHAVVISAVGPGGDLHVRYLCKRIRHDAPRISIIVGRWGYTGNRERITVSLRQRGADHIVTTFE